MQGNWRRYIRCPLNIFGRPMGQSIDSSVASIDILCQAGANYGTSFLKFCKKSSIAFNEASFRAGVQSARQPAVPLQTRHPGQYRTGSSQRVSLRVNCEQHQQWVVAALTQLFHVRVNVDVRTWGVVVYVAFLGPQKLAKNYTYEVRQRQLFYFENDYY